MVLADSRAPASLAAPKVSLRIYVTHICHMLYAGTIKKRSRSVEEIALLWAWEKFYVAGVDAWVYGFFVVFFFNRYSVEELYWINHSDYTSQYNYSC